MLTRLSTAFAFFLTAPAAFKIYTLSLHDALPISEISESVNFCVMEAIKLCRLDTPIIFIEARINLSRFVVTGCAAKTSATVTFDDKSAQIYARFDKNDRRIQPAEFYRFRSEERFS